MKYATTPNIAEHITIGIIASPSSPSVIFTALEVPINIIKTNINIPIPPIYSIFSAYIGFIIDKSTALFPVSPKKFTNAHTKTAIIP